MTGIRGWEQAAALQLDPEVKATDSYARDRAGRMAGALTAYARHRDFAFVAELNDDAYSAELHRADARAALHLWPGLLAMVEPS